MTTVKLTIAAILALAALSLAACASPQLANDSLSPREARIAEYQCDRDFNATRNLFIAALQLKQCLEAHGFRRTR